MTHIITSAGCTTQVNWPRAHIVLRWQVGDGTNLKPCWPIANLSCHYAYRSLAERLATCALLEAGRRERD